ncbi:MAG: hypothetical protein QXY78_03945 [Thermoplasmata archaeon]
MFFPIIGCFLTLLSPIQSVTPHAAPQQLQQSSNQFFGAYNFREVIFEEQPREHPLEYYQFDKIQQGVYEDIMIYHATDNTYEQYHDFIISWDSNNSAWNFTYSIGGGTPKSVILFYEISFSLQPTPVKNFTIYFPRYTYLEQEIADVFNFFFTQQPNSYHSYYTGYYTFNNVPSGRFSLYGNVSANNSLFNLLDYNSTYSDDYINFSYVVDDSTLYYQLYKNTTWNSSRSIYFSSVLLPDNLRAYMEARGVFAYIPQTELSDFQDLFFTLADTPIYYLTTWFNFELLGFNFGIAIISLLSLLLVLFIVKKLTK